MILDMEKKEIQRKMRKNGKSKLTVFHKIQLFSIYVMTSP